MSTCWDKKSGNIVAKQGHQISLKREKKEAIERENERIRNLPSKPNKLTIQEMIFYFCLICKNMENIINKVIPSRDLVDTFLQYLYPRKIFLTGYDINSNLALSSKYFGECTPYGTYKNNKFYPKHNFRKMWYNIKHIDSYSFCIYFFNGFTNIHSLYDYCIDFNINNLSLNKKWLDMLNIKYEIKDGVYKVKINYLIDNCPKFDIFKNRLNFLLDIDSNKQRNKYKFRYIIDPRNDYFKMKQIWNVCKILNKFGYFNK